MKKEIGIIGLGKMGSGLALNLIEKGWRVVGYNRSIEKAKELESSGLIVAESIEDLVSKLGEDKVIWTMLTSGEPTQSALFRDNGIINYLNPGDIVIEGGNSHFKEDKENARRLQEKQIKYLDVGVSGGPSGARNGACCMIGGEEETFKGVEALFKDISLENGYKFFNGHGAGHFIKMVHNGIEYGMMQSIAEGFNLIKNSEYKFDLVDVAEIYNNGSVIESRLINWLLEGYKKYGEDLEEMSGSVAHSGEGLWTVETAKELSIDVPVIEKSLDFRIESHKQPSYTGKILTMLRNMFGHHSTKNP